MSHTSEHRISVRGFHIDVFQHVNNARYLEFLEEARWLFLQETGIRQAIGTEYGMAISEIHIRYRHAARMGDTLIITTRLIASGSRIAQVEQHIYRQSDHKTIAQAQVHFMLTHPQTGSAVRFPPEVHASIQAALSASTPPTS